MSKSTRTYVAFRIGSNSANQPMCQKMALGFIEASNRKQAEKLAGEEHGASCYGNQHLEIVAGRFVDSDIWNDLNARTAA